MCKEEQGWGNTISGNGRRVDVCSVEDRDDKIVLGKYRIGLPRTE